MVYTWVYSVFKGSKPTIFVVGFGVTGRILGFGLSACRD